MASSVMSQTTLCGAIGSSEKNSGSRSSLLVNPAARLKARSVLRMRHAEVGDIIGNQMNAVAGIDHVDQGRQAGRHHQGRQRR